MTLHLHHIRIVIEESRYMRLVCRVLIRNNGALCVRCVVLSTTKFLDH